MRSLKICIYYFIFFTIPAWVVKTMAFKKKGEINKLDKDFIFMFCNNKMCSLSLFLSVFSDISRQYYGSRATQCRRPAVHCALHPFITFQTSNNSQTQRERKERDSVPRCVQTIIQTRYTVCCVLLRPQPELQENKCNPNRTTKL